MPDAAADGGSSSWKTRTNILASLRHNIRGAIRRPYVRMQRRRISRRRARAIRPRARAPLSALIPRTGTLSVPTWALRGAVSGQSSSQFFEPLYIIVA